jgi:hydrophobe/amphiphile efflux-3 (HAE3) family protein
MKDKLFRFIINRRVFVLITLTAITLFLGGLASKVKIDNSIETYFFEKEVEEFDRFLDQFGTDEYIVIAFADEDVFTNENLHVIDSISKKLEKLQYVRRVNSLTTIKTFYRDGESAYFGFLVKKIPISPGEWRSIKEKVFKDPFISNILISQDGTRTAIVAEVDHIIGENDYKLDLVNQIREMLKEEGARTGKHFYIAGGPVLNDALLRYSQQDTSTFTPIMILFMIVIVFLMFRSLKLVFLPVFIAILSLTWTYGALQLLGYKINLVSGMINPLILVIAIADSIHLMSGYIQEAAEGKRDKIQCIRNCFVHLVTPCFMTSITTIFGLLSLLTSDLVVIRQFGLAAALGIFFAFFITIFLLPVLFSFFHYPKETYRERIKTGFFTKLLVWIGNWQKTKAIIILASAVLVFILIAPRLSNLTVGTNTLDYFRKDSTVRTQAEWIDTNIGGTTTLEFWLQTGKEDALKNPALLGKVEEFQNYLEKIHGITGVISPVDVVKVLNRAHNEGKEENFVIPASSAEIAQYLLLVEGSKDIKTLLSDDYSSGRITARILIGESRELALRLPEIEKQMKRIFGNTVKVTSTGVVYLMSRMQLYLLSSQVKSFTLAFIVIFIFILIMLRSLKIGIFAIIPNFMPIVFTIALMPVLGIALDVGTANIACIALGLVVDDTIHFLSRLKLELKEAKDTRTAVARAIVKVGRPILYTSIILSLGILVLLLASFNPLVNFGILTSIVIILALFFDLMFLPSLIGFFRLTPKQKS